MVKVCICIYNDCLVLWLQLGLGLILGIKIYKYSQDSNLSILGLQLGKWFQGQFLKEVQSQGVHRGQGQGQGYHKGQGQWYYQDEGYNYGQYKNYDEGWK